MAHDVLNQLKNAELDGVTTIEFPDMEHRQFKDTVIPFTVGYVSQERFGVIDVSYIDHTITVAPVAVE